jgi:hypothetical protein
MLFLMFFLNLILAQEANPRITVDGSILLRSPIFVQLNLINFRKLLESGNDLAIKDFISRNHNYLYGNIARENYLHILIREKKSDYLSFLLEKINELAPEEKEKAFLSKNIHGDMPLAYSLKLSDMENFFIIFNSFKDDKELFKKVLNFKSGSGHTVLHYAVYLNNLSALNLLLDEIKKFDMPEQLVLLNETDGYFQKTPFYIATERRSLAAMNLLKDHGADIKTGRYISSTRYLRPEDLITEDDGQDVLNVFGIVPVKKSSCFSCFGKK